MKLYIQNMKTIRKRVKKIEKFIKTLRKPQVLQTDPQYKIQLTGAQQKIYDNILTANHAERSETYHEAHDAFAYNQEHALEILKKYPLTQCIAKVNGAMTSKYCCTTEEVKQHYERQEI